MMAHRSAATALRRAALIATAVLAVSAAPAAAQDPAAPDITDAAFLAQAAQANRFEIVTGRLADRRGSRRIVRRLGRMFVRDHTAALAQGAAVAAKLGVTPPAGVSRQQAAVVEKLRGLRGRRFDRAWLRAQLAAHVQAVALHLSGALNGDSADVRRLATLALPVVSGHLGELTVAANHAGAH